MASQAERECLMNHGITVGLQSQNVYYLALPRKTLPSPGPGSEERKTQRLYMSVIICCPTICVASKALRQKMEKADTERPL